jgi:hypothetical protein
VGEEGSKGCTTQSTIEDKSSVCAAHNRALSFAE